MPQSIPEPLPWPSSQPCKPSLLAHWHVPSEAGRYFETDSAQPHIALAFVPFQQVRDEGGLQPLVGLQPRNPTNELDVPGAL